MSAYNPQVSVTHKSSPRLKGYKSGTDKYNTISGAFWNSNFFPQTSGKKFFVYHHMIFTFIWIKHTWNVTKWGSIFDHDLPSKLEIQCETGTVIRACTYHLILLGIPPSLI